MILPPRANKIMAGFRQGLALYMPPFERTPPSLQLVIPGDLATFVPHGSGLESVTHPDYMEHMVLQNTS